MPAPDRLIWWEPYRATVEASRRELTAAGVLSWAFWLKVELIVAVFVGAAIALFRFAYPGAFLPITQLVGCAVAAPIVLLLLMCVKGLAPVRVDVRTDRILLSKGDSGVLIPRERLASAVVVEDDAGVAWMVIEYRTPRGKDRRRMVAVSGKVDVGELEALLERLV